MLYDIVQFSAHNVESQSMLNLPEFIHPALSQQQQLDHQNLNLRNTPPSIATGSLRSSQDSMPKTIQLNSLSEFLREHVAKDIEKLQAANDPSELLSQLDHYDTLWLDLEINPENNQLIDGAFLVNDTYWRFDAKQFQTQTLLIYILLDKARYLGGHHLIEFDLPHLILLLIKALSTPNAKHKFLLSKLADSKTLHHWQGKAWDTLILSCLFIPHQPSHA